MRYRSCFCICYSQVLKACLMVRLSEYIAIARIFPPGKGRMTALIALQIGISAVALARYAIERQIFKAVTESRYEHTALLFGFFTLAFVCIMVFKYGVKILTAQLVQQNAEYLKTCIFKSALYLPPTATAEKHDALSAMAFDAEELARFVPVDLLELGTALGTFAAYAAFCAYLSPVLALCALLLLIPSVLIEQCFLPHITAQYKKVSQSESTLRTRLQEMIRTVAIIKVFSIHQRVSAHCAEADERRYRNKLKSTRLNVLLFTGGNTLSYIAVFGSFVASAVLYTYRFIELPDLIVALGLIEGGMVWPASNFLQQFTALANSKACFERIKRFLPDQKEPDTDTQRSYSIKRGGQLTVELDGIVFAHPAPKKPAGTEELSAAVERKPVLNGLQLHIPHGSHICIAGESGAGKTTLAYMLLGLLEPQHGTVRFYYNGRLYEGDRRNLIAYVPQTGALFLDSIAENIRFGDMTAEAPQIIEAARRAGAHSFIMETEQQYATLTGGKEEKFSGGQAQRIAIARAFLKNSPLLVMDEPSSALDSVSEQRIAEAIQRYEGTVIFISHRKALIQAADTVYRLESGRLYHEQKGEPQ